MRLPLAVLVLFAAPAIPGSTLEVPLGYPTIQAALDAAVSGDTVRVAPGTYKEHDLVVVGKHITLLGFGGASLTVIDAEGLGRCLSVVGSGAGETHLEGFTLRGGRPPVAGSGLGGCDGGGLLFSTGALVVAGCVFEGNEAGRGGVGAQGWSPKGTGGSGGAGGSGGRGGAVFVASGATVTIQNCNLVDNRVGLAGAGGPPGSGGGWGASGSPPTQGPPGQPGRTGGVQAEGTAVRVLHCTLLDNQSFAVQAPQASSVHNSILRSSLAPVQLQGPALVTYNNIQGGAAGTNIDAPPLFVDEAGRDLRLASTSPCIDAGDASLTNLPSVDIGSDEHYSLPGTGEDLDTQLTINGVPKGTATSAAVTAGDALVLLVTSPGQSFASAPLLLAVQPFASITPMPIDPALTGVALNTTWPSLALLSSSPLPAAGLRIDITVPAGLTGLTVRLQAFALSSTATNGTWASSRGLEARIE